LLAHARADRGANPRDCSSGPEVRDRTGSVAGAHEIRRKGGASVATLPPVAIVASTRCNRTDARKWAAQVGSVLTPELVATIQSAHQPDG
jgi:hypothetical protein